MKGMAEFSNFSLLTAGAERPGFGWTMLWLASLSSVSPVVFAQATPPRPDSGEILREVSPLLPQVNPGKGRVTEPPEVQRPAGRKGTGGRTVLVKAFRFVGNEHIAADKLLRDIPALAQGGGTQLGLAGLEAVADEVTRYYRSKGYLLATAYIQAQDVSDGVVTITVLEGKLGAAKVTGKVGYSPERLERYLKEALCGDAKRGCTGSVLERSRIDRAMGLVADLPGVAGASGTLSPGSRRGTSDLAVDMVAGPAWNGQLGADNYGNSFVGRDRLVGTLRFNNPGGFGDRLSLDAATSGKGMSSGGLDYSVPVGYAGWRAGLGYTHSIYTLGAPFDVTKAHGQADVLTPYVSYPVIRSLENNLNLHVGYSAKWLQDSVLDSTFKKDEGVGSIGIDGNAVDTVAGGGVTIYGITLSHGRLAYGGAAAPVGVPDNSGGFDKLNYNLSRDQTLSYTGVGNRVSLYGALRGQVADRNLDAAEKFTLGGPDGVRAYPVGEAIGDEGAIATLELRYSAAVPLGGGSDVTLSLFRDQGWLTVNHTTWNGYNGPAHRKLGGNGLSVSLARRDQYAVKLMWAARDRHGEAATSDVDSPSRLWVQGALFF